MRTRRLESLATYVDYFHAAAKPAGRRRLGLELETIGYRSEDLARIGPPTVQRVMDWFAREATDVEREGETTIAVLTDRGLISPEPGGQIEFSGRPQTRAAEVQADAEWFLTKLAEVARRERLTFIACGFDPLRTRGEQRWVAKRRYAILRPYLEAHGHRGVDMMTRTCATQISLDYSSPAELAKMYVIGNLFGPIVAAMFANSPYEDGRRSGYKSTRYGVWLQTDEARCGVAPAAFLDPLTLDGLVEAMLDVPTVFVRRQADLFPTHGQLLQEVRDPRFEDFIMLLSTIYTDARARTYVEMRSADSGSLPDALALMTFWRGLTYDATALDAALAIVPQLNRAGYARLAEAVSAIGLEACECGVAVMPIARQLLRIAREGLTRIAPDEVSFLGPLEDRIAQGVTPADLLLQRCGDDIVAAIHALRIA